MNLMKEQGDSSNPACSIQHAISRHRFNATPLQLVNVNATRLGTIVWHAAACFHHDLSALEPGGGVLVSPSAMALKDQAEEELASWSAETKRSAAQKVVCAMSCSTRCSRSAPRGHHFPEVPRNGATL